MAPTRGFGGRLLSVLETDPGSTPTNPAFTKVSDFVQSVKLSMDPKNEVYHDIGSYDGQAFIEGLPEYGLKIEYLLHTGRKTNMDGAINRQSDNTLESRTFEVSVGRDDATVGYFTVKGAKPETCTVKGEVGKPIEVSIGYKALSVVRATVEPTIGTGSRETASLGTKALFSASSITRGGSAVAYITRAADFTVSHELTVEGTDGQTGPKAIFEGKREIKGNCDITVDDGGVALADTVMAGTEASVVYNLGASGAPKATFGTTRWDNFELDLAVGESHVKRSVPWTALTATMATVA